MNANLKQESTKNFRYWNIRSTFDLAIYL